MPSELFELGGVDAAVLGGVERAALEAVAAEHSAVEPGSDATGLDDACDGAGIDRLPADHVGRRPARRRVRRPGRGPEPPQHQPGSDAGASAGERAHRAGVTDAIRNADLHPLARPVSLGDRQGDAQPVLARLEVVDRDAGELAAAERAGEADQQQRAIAQLGRSSPIDARISRSTAIRAASLERGPSPASRAVRSSSA